MARGEPCSTAKGMGISVGSGAVLSHTISKQLAAGSLSTSF